MEIILSDMMGGDDCPYGEIIKKDQENHIIMGSVSIFLDKLKIMIIILIF